MSAILQIAGVLLIIFAIADLCLANFGGIDLTGVTWSPIAAGVAGSVLMRLGGGGDE